MLSVLRVRPDLFAEEGVLAVGVALLLGAVVDEFIAVRLLSFITIALAIVWIGIARYAGNRFRAMTEDS